MNQTVAIFCDNGGPDVELLILATLKHFTSFPSTNLSFGADKKRPHSITNF